MFESAEARGTAWGRHEPGGALIVPPQSMMNHLETDSTAASSGRMWSLKFVFGQRLVTVSVPPRLVLTVLAMSLGCYLLGLSSANGDTRRQTEMVALLKERNQQLERSLKEREAERDEMSALAETRSEELWGELNSRDRELSELWRVVGTAIGEQPQRRGLSSRGASTAPDRYRALQARIDSNGAELSRLSAATKKFQARHIPSAVPCKGDMTSGFGYRIHPLYGYSKLHSGCDFTTDYGTPIQATADGKVVRSEWFGGYGQTIEIEHSLGYKTLYAHCDTLKVKKGQTVKKGQPIATVGTTGLSSGPHCHYEVHRNGKPINPSDFYPHR